MNGNFFSVFVWFFLGGFLVSLGVFCFFPNYVSRPFELFKLCCSFFRFKSEQLFFYMANKYELSCSDPHSAHVLCRGRDNQLCLITSFMVMRRVGSPAIICFNK